MNRANFGNILHLDKAPRSQRSQSIRRTLKSVSGSFIAGGLLIYAFIKAFDVLTHGGWNIAFSDWTGEKLIASCLPHGISLPAIHLMALYGLLAATIWCLWKFRSAANQARERAMLERDKQESIRRSLQSITGLLAETVAEHNNRIYCWHMQREMTGQRGSRRMLTSCQNISIAMAAMSRFAFSTLSDPTKYADRNSDSIVLDFEHSLASELQQDASENRGRLS